MPAPLERNSNLVLNEPFSLNPPPVENGLTRAANPRQNASLYPSSTQASNIFERLMQNDGTEQNIPGLTVTPPTRGANDPPGTLQSGTVTFQRDHTYRSDNGTGVRVNAGLDGRYLRDEDVFRNRNLGGGTITGGGQLNAGAGVAAGLGSLETVGQPGNLQPALGAQLSGRAGNIGGRPVYSGELRATIAGQRAAASVVGRMDSNGQRSLRLDGFLRLDEGVTINPSVTLSDGPRANDARRIYRLEGQAQLNPNLSLNGFVQREEGGVGRGINSAGFRLQYQLRF